MTSFNLILLLLKHLRLLKDLRLLYLKRFIFSPQFIHVADSWSFPFYCAHLDRWYLNLIGCSLFLSFECLTKFIKIHSISFSIAYSSQKQFDIFICNSLSDSNEKLFHFACINYGCPWRQFIKQNLSIIIPSFKNFDSLFIKLFFQLYFFIQQSQKCYVGFFSQNKTRLPKISLLKFSKCQFIIISS